MPRTRRVIDTSRPVDGEWCSAVCSPAHCLDADGYCRARYDERVQRVLKQFQTDAFSLMAGANELPMKPDSAVDMLVNRVGLAWIEYKRLRDFLRE